MYNQIAHFGDVSDGVLPWVGLNRVQKDPWHQLLVQIIIPLRHYCSDLSKLVGWWWQILNQLHNSIITHDPIMTKVEVEEFYLALLQPTFRISWSENPAACNFTLYGLTDY